MKKNHSMEKTIENQKQKMEEKLRKDGLLSTKVMITTNKKRYATSIPMHEGKLLK